MSQYFVLAYKRSIGHLIEPVYETSEVADAGAKRLAWELKYQSEGKDVEVAILTAPTLADLQRTHARYFKTAAELTG
jgi:hypothetical protein